MVGEMPDWEAIERAYRAGQISVRAIGDQHGVGESTIRKRASTHGWLRDLADQVQRSTREKLARRPVRSGGAQDKVRTDSEIIEEAAEIGAAVVLAHRVELRFWRGLAQKLGAALAEMDVTEENHDKFARSLNAGVDAQLKVIKGEREAFNLDQQTPPENNTPTGLGHFYGESDT